MRGRSVSQACSTAGYAWSGRPTEPSDAAARAAAEALKILDEHQVEPLPDEVCEALDRMLADVGVKA